MNHRRMVDGMLGKRGFFVAVHGAQWALIICVFLCGLRVRAAEPPAELPGRPAPMATSGQAPQTGGPTDQALAGKPQIVRAGEVPAGMGAKDWATIQDQLPDSALLVSPEIKLAASDGIAGDHFGYAVAVDGDVAIVGAESDNPGSGSGAGSAYVFERHAGGTNAWGQVKKLVASDGAASDHFGNRVAIAGDVIVIGAYAADPGGVSLAGAAYVFERDAGGTNNWGEVRKLTAFDGASGDIFGSAVAVAGDIALVGAQGDDSNKGAAYAFERNIGGTNTWALVRKLTASDGAAGDRFGYAVALAGDTALIGAYDKDAGQGAAYVFERNIGGTNNWGEVKKLTAADGAASDNFGQSLALAGNVAVVGAIYATGAVASAGSAYVFERNIGGTNAWGQVKKLAASDGAANDQFGIAVSLAGNMVLVGAQLADLGTMTNAGAAYVFDRHVGGTNAWGQVRKLTASDGVTNDYFGSSVSIAGDVALAGAWGKEASKGAAYIMPVALETKNFRLTARPTASDGEGDDYFGCSVSVAGDVAIIGAYAKSNRTGAAYIFERNVGGTNAWGQVCKLTAADGVQTDYFGHSVSMAGDVALVGADWSSPGGVHCAGEAYVFERNAGGSNAWGQAKKLLPADGAVGDLFGCSVSAAGDVALVGAYGATYGKAYVFERNAGGSNIWGQVKKLTASGAVLYDDFGYSVSVAGDVALVGARYTDLSGKSYAGAAYVFERNAGGTNNWGQVKKLTSSDCAADDYFGWSVAVAGDVALVAASYANLGGITNAGAAYVFERNAGGTNNWGQVRKLTSPHATAWYNFGSSVSVAGDVAIVMDKYYPYIFERNAGGTNAWGLSQDLYMLYSGDSVSVAGDVALIGNADYECAYVFEKITNYPMVNISILGTNGVAIANGSEASADKGTDFGSLTFGPALTNVFAVTNSGTGDLSINGVTTGGVGAARFRVNGMPGAVSPGAASNFSIVFDASVVGIYTATVAVANNSGTTSYVFGVKGTSLSQGAIGITPATLNYPATYGGADPAAQAFAVTNSGQTAFTFTNTVAYSSGASGWFTPSALTGSVSAAGSLAVTGSVSISGLGVGTYYATNTVSSPAATNSPQTLVATLTVNKADQAITFPEIADQKTTNIVSLSATASSGLAVSFAASGPAQITGGTTLSFTGAGTVSIVASQAGEANWNSAPNVTNSFNVTRANQVIAFPAIADQALTNTVGLSATASSGLPVSFSVGAGPAQIAGSNQLSFTATGRVSIAASQAGDSNWNAAPSVTNSFIVTAAPAPSLSAPTNVVASDGRYADYVALSWSAVSGASGYQVWRGTNSEQLSVSSERSAGDSGRSQIGQTTGTNFNDASAGGGTLCYYWVKATNSATTSVFSASDSGWRRSAHFSHYADVDIDGDRKADLVIFDRLTGTWRAKLSGSGYAEVSGVFGDSACTLVPGDYDGDGKTDPGIYAELTGLWTVMLSSMGYRQASAILGGMGCAPTPGDFDGDAKTDLGVYRSATGGWTVKLSASGYAEAGTTFGDAGHLPVQRDYDGDRKYDPAIYHLADGTWRVMLSASGYGVATAVGFGGTGYAPVVGDYDGDGKADPALYESTGLWTVMLSGSGYLIAYGTLGGSGYTALPGDYDGDGKTDPAVYHTSSGRWLVMLSGSGYGIATTVFGGEGCDPVGFRPE